MRVNLKLIRVGMSMQEAVIAKWHKAVGESFKDGDVLYEIETEKVTQEVTASGSGKVLEVFVREGDTVAVGANVCAVDITLPK
jgi:pyruvate/2-oxoglutarate dehydrogenase complex dihydrolipoamide acyltransferase (E2) component